MNLGAPEIGLIVFAILLLFGYKKLPDASRSIGRSLRIFKGEMKGMKDDDVPVKDPATTTPAMVAQAVGQLAPDVASDDASAQLLEEARLAEARAAELRARANEARKDSPRTDRAQSADVPR